MMVLTISNGSSSLRGFIKGLEDKQDEDDKDAVWGKVVTARLPMVLVNIHVQVQADEYQVGGAKVALESN